MDLVSAAKIFKNFSEQEKKTLIKWWDLMEFKKDDKILEKGKVRPYMYVLLSGKLEANVISTLEKRYKVAIEPGDSFGETGLFTNYPRMASVVSLESGFMLQIERKMFAHFMKENPATANKIMVVIIYSLINRLRNISHEFY
jgi:CRP-like cAMP-binding protein